MGIIRKTKSVEVLLKLFEQYDGAISVIDLIERLHLKMNKTTVYRILERLEEDTILHSLIDKDGLRRYARCVDIKTGLQKESHPHFQCDNCGKVECLPNEVSVPKLNNYQIDSVKFLMIGKCEDCFSET